LIAETRLRVEQTLLDEEAVLAIGVSRAERLAVIMHHAKRFLHCWPTAARQHAVRLDRC